MVLQQQTRVAVWGWAAPGETVKVETSWGASAETAAAGNGQWMAKIKTPAAQSLDNGLHPETITIQGKNTIVLQDVLIGELWLCSGQSNMDMRITPDAEQPWSSGDSSWATESAKADRPGLRLCSLAKAVAPVPQSHGKGVWQASTAETASHFSAAGYYFGTYLQERLQVPVGLVVSVWPGTCIEKWLSTQGLRSVPDFGRAMTAGHGIVMQTTPSTPPDLSTLYNGMIAPLTPMTFKGVIWYQGESNVGRADLYSQLFPAMIQDWRRSFGNPNMAFYFVQIAPFKYSTNALIPVAAGGELRHAQTAALKLPHTGEALTCDITDPANLHPRTKLEVGRRLALQALAKTYGIEGIEADGPQAKEARARGAAVNVVFDCAKDGLVARDGQPLNCFEIAGSDGKFVPATAVLQDNVVVVSSPQVAVPRHVRFGYGEIDVPNLSGKNGLPVAQFLLTVK
jgi:sialate O-acetylesterase